MCVRNPSRAWLAAAVALSCLLTIPARAVSIDWATVRNGGNAADTTGYGAVNYTYMVGKYEVTIQQYTDFLNAAATSDPYGLYNPSMATDLNVAGISRSGTSGSYAYSVLNNAGNSGNRPITYVSWFDAARFANWLHNGQGSGSTETGAYTLNGQTSGTTPARNPGAVVYIPTANEWYKAAFYSPLLNSGSGGYYSYATQSNTAPGNVIGSGTNQANYYAAGVGFSVTQQFTLVGTQNYLTNAGAFSSNASYYGTYDQTGSVLEWNDITGAASGLKQLRGGAWDRTASSAISSAGFDTVPTNQISAYGFRLAAVPEPSTYAMALAGLACGGFSMWRRRKRA